MPALLRCFITIVAFFAVTSGCAVLHHAQIGDIDNRQIYSFKPIDIKLSEMGFNIDEASDIARRVSRNPKSQEQINTITDSIKLFQMGPVTGNPVFSDRYARILVYRLYEVCPSGLITGLSSIRETRKYPVISGEIVKVTGYCMTPRR